MRKLLHHSVAHMHTDPGDPFEMSVSLKEANYNSVQILFL